MLTWWGSCYCCSPLWFSKGKQQYHVWAYLIMKQLLLLHVLLFLWQIYSWHSYHNTHINHIYNTHIHCGVNFTNPIIFSETTAPEDFLVFTNMDCVENDWDSTHGLSTSSCLWYCLSRADCVAVVYTDRCYRKSVCMPGAAGYRLYIVSSRE